MTQAGRVLARQRPLPGYANAFAGARSVPPVAPTARFGITCPACGRKRVVGAARWRAFRARPALPRLCWDCAQRAKAAAARPAPQPAPEPVPAALAPGDPALPTALAPGSEAKFRLMAARVKRRLPVTRAGDFGFYKNVGRVAEILAEVVAAGRGRAPAEAPAEDFEP